MTPLIIKTECTYSNVRMSRLWAAVTHPEEMRKWFFESMHSFIPECGFSTRFNVKRKDKNYVHIWKVVEVIPGKKISYEWRYANYPGNSMVTFELFPENVDSKLILIHAGTDSFAANNPDFTTENCADGWNYFICKRLKEYLSVQPG
jgi:uncharacterized protein YndB with AHSA1/START domain